VRWFDKKYGRDLYDRLRRRSQRVGKMDYEQLFSDLKALYDATV
jgi:hypothetical protein